MRPATLRALIGSATPPPADAQAPLRVLRAVEAVARLGSAARAAEALHQSTTAVSRAVAQAEALLGLPLFERGARGMAGTPAAMQLAARVRRALAALQHGGGAPLAARATEAMLRALATIAETRSETTTGQHLGISQSAVHQSLRQLEHAARTALFQRSVRGTRLTEAGEQVLRGAKLALAELRTGHEELAALRGLSPGRVAVGALPMASDVLVPQALAQLFAAQPGVMATVADGTYQALVHQLRHGDLDLVVGPLRGADAPADVVEDLLFVDRLVPVVRSTHPVLQTAGGRRRRGPVTLAALMRWPWIGPLPGTPARAAFERAFRTAGLPVPAVALQVNSPAVVRSVLMSGDHVALLSALQIRAEVDSQLLSVVPAPVQGTERPIGTMMRRDGLASPALRGMLLALQAEAARVLAGS